jgi:TonB family protein
MPSHTGNTAASLERRLHARQRLSAIVYLDIGAGNGGIVLNLSDEGLGFQAVGPLGKQKELSLRIKLPSTQSRVEVAAEIAWVSDSNRQAGVRFVDAHSEGRVQIQEWIRSLAPPPAPPEESPKQEEAAAETVLKQESIREPEKKEEPIPVSEIASPEPIRERVPGLAEVEARDVILNPQDVVLNPQEDAPVPRKLEQLTQPVVEHSEAPFLVRPAMQTEAAQDADLPIPITPVRVEPENSEAIIVARRRDGAERESAQGWSAPVARSSAMAIPLPPDPPLRPVQLYVPAVETSSDPAPAPASTSFSVPAAASAKLVWSHTALAGFFTLCAVVCFGIGTWVGLIVRHRHPAESAVAPVNAVQSAGTSMNATAAASNDRLASIASEKYRKGASANRSSLPSPKVAASGSSRRTTAAEENPPSSNESQIAAAPAIGKEQESNPPVAAPLENSASPEKNAAPVAITNETAPPAASAAENSAAAGTSPRMVGGLVLKPSDRFNPSHLAYRVEAVYPAEALAQRIEGVVKIQQAVGADGSVRGVKLLSGPAVLAPAALEAARYWRYLPALLNGQPVESEQNIEIQFRLPE